MDFSQFLLALRARRKAFVMVLAATIVTAIAVALIVPKTYKSSATILVDAVDQQTMSPARLSARERAGYVATQMDLIRSGRVAREVVRDLRLAQDPVIREAWESETGGAGSIEQWISSRLVENLLVDTSGGNIVFVEYSARNPRRAAAVANAFAQAYIDTALELRTVPTREAAEWFEEQLKGLRVRVQEAQARLAGYQKDKGIAFVDERADVDTARLAELTRQYLAARNATYDAASRYEQARQVLADSASADAIPEVLASEHINGLKLGLVRTEARLHELGAVLGPRHPVYARTVAEAEGLREQLAGEMKKLVVGLGNALAQSRKREADLKAAVEAQHRRVQDMKAARVQMAVLTRDVESAQRAYDAVLERTMVNRIDSRATQTNVALLTPAVEPLRHAHPKVGIISMLSVLIGALLAAGVVYLLEMLDRRVRSRADLESRLAVPSLGRLSRWQPSGGRLLPSPVLRPARALPHPW